MTWFEIANWVENEYNSYVDWDEEFFVCPECGEPVYKADWAGDEYIFEGKCPICLEKIV